MQENVKWFSLRGKLEVTDWGYLGLLSPRYNKSRCNKNHLQAPRPTILPGAAGTFTPLSLISRSNTWRNFSILTEIHLISRGLICFKIFFSLHKLHLLSLFPELPLQLGHGLHCRWVKGRISQQPGQLTLFQQLAFPFFLARETGQQKNRSSYLSAEGLLLGSAWVRVRKRTIKSLG